jgi:hypothetical protein
MSKVITVSRNFPKGHPKAGQPTYFVEKIWRSLSTGKNEVISTSDDLNNERYYFLNRDFNPKHHTIRAGKRWKTGDMASLRVWSGKPYNSPQIIIAPDVEITVKDISMYNDWNTWIDGKQISQSVFNELAQNDGLSPLDLQNWFKKNITPQKLFSGQILCFTKIQLSY